MESFNDLFVASKGAPVQYDGSTLHLADRVSLEKTNRFRIVIEQAKKSPRQGIYVSVPYRGKGHFIVEGKKVSKGVALWDGLGAQELEFEVHTSASEFIVKNVWDNHGGMDFGRFGAATIIENLRGGKRYRCNDSLQNTEFAAVVFRIEFLTN